MTQCSIPLNVVPICFKSMIQLIKLEVTTFRNLSKFNRCIFLECLLCASRNGPHLCCEVICDLKENFIYLGNWNSSLNIQNRLQQFSEMIRVQWQATKPTVWVSLPFPGVFIFLPICLPIIAVLCARPRTQKHLTKTSQVFTYVDFQKSQPKQKWNKKKKILKILLNHLLFNEPPFWIFLIYGEYVILML